MSRVPPLDQQPEWADLVTSWRNNLTPTPAGRSYVIGIGRRVHDVDTCIAARCSACDAAYRAMAIIAEAGGTATQQRAAQLYADLTGTAAA
jgi:hypothetical protein